MSDGTIFFLFVSLTRVVKRSLPGFSPFLTITEVLFGGQTSSSPRNENEVCQAFPGWLGREGAVLLEETEEVEMVGLGDVA